MDKKFNEKCDESYAQRGLCLSYFHKVFNTYPSKLHIRDDYLEHIKDFHDPILIYVALYLYDNYEIAQKYFGTNPDKNNSQSVNSFNNDACGVLNRWLDQQRNFYTNFATCNYNSSYWYIYIEPLWKRLEEYYPTKKRCKRFNGNYNTLKSSNNEYVKNKSYQQMPEEYVCYKNVGDEQNNHENNNNYIKENCAKLSILFYLGEIYSLFNEESNETQSSPNKYCYDSKMNEKINYTLVLKAEKSYFCESLSSTITLPIIVTVLGTIFLAFFLNEFTPIGSVLGTRPKNKIRLREEINEDVGYNEYLTSRNNNINTATDKNIIYYKSMN